MNVKNLGSSRRPVLLTGLSGLKLKKKMWSCCVGWPMILYADDVVFCRTTNCSVWHFPVWKDQNKTTTDWYKITLINFVLTKPKHYNSSKIKTDGSLWLKKLRPQRNYINIYLKHLKPSKQFCCLIQTMELFLVTLTAEERFSPKRRRGLVFLLKGAGLLQRFSTQMCFCGVLVESKTSWFNWLKFT